MSSFAHVRNLLHVQFWSSTLFRIWIKSTQSKKLNTFGPGSNFKKTLNQKCIYVAFQTRDNELFQTLLDQNLEPRVVEV